MGVKNELAPNIRCKESQMKLSITSARAAKSTPQAQIAYQDEEISNFWNQSGDLVPAVDLLLWTTATCSEASTGGS